MFRARVLSFIGWIVLSLWSRTVRIQFVNKAVPDRLASEGKNVIYAFWHGRQFLLFHSHRNTGIVIPASESRDGEIQARILKYFGFDVVRGSSKRKGDRALLGLVDRLRKGKSLALAVDGPRGPIYEAKQGVTYMAGKLNKPIVPVMTGAEALLAPRKDLGQVFAPEAVHQGGHHVRRSDRRERHKRGRTRDETEGIRGCAEQTHGAGGRLL